MTEPKKTKPKAKKKLTKQEKKRIAEKKKADAEEAARRAGHLYIYCKHPETQEEQIIETSRKLQQVIKDLMDTGIKYGADFVEQEIRIQGYAQEIDKEEKVIRYVPVTIAEGPVKDVMQKLGSSLLSKEQAVVHLRRFITRLMDQSELTMCSFATVFEGDRDGVTMTGESVIDSNEGVVKPTHYIVMDNSLKSLTSRVKEYGEGIGVNYPEDQDALKKIITPGDAEFSVPTTSGL